jgi:carboxymethylenebutenolidase
MRMATETGASITTRRVRYGNSVEASIAAPDRPGPHRTIILLHERYGLVQHTLDLSEKFARHGYLCLAPNLFSRDPEQDKLAAGEISRELPDPQVLEDVGASIAYLRASEPQAQADKVAVMGVCQTGRYPIVLAAHRDDISAAIVFYGATYNPRDWEINEHHPETMEALIARVQAPVLGIFGERDFLITLDDVRRWRGELENHRKSYRIKIFADMPHGWLNDTMPGRYRQPEAEEAWQMVMAFLERANSGGYPANRVHWEFESDSAIDYDPSKNVRLA